MTDGIVQKVFNKELHYYDNYESMNPDITINQHLEIIEQIMQELIEEIKKTFQNEGCTCEQYGLIHETVLWGRKQLIGDNK